MSDDEISALLGDDPADIVVCGGSHVPFDRVVTGVRVINVGSVGEAPRGAGPFLHADATLIEVGAATSRTTSAHRDRGGLGGVSAPPIVTIERMVVPLGKAA